MQLLKDTLLLSEHTTELQSLMSDLSASHQTASFYKMLKCSITILEEDDLERQLVMNLLADPESNRYVHDVNACVRIIEILTTSNVVPELSVNLQAFPYLLCPHVQFYGF